MADDTPTRWSTPVAAVVAAAVGGVVFAVPATVGSDAAGRVILGIAAVAMLGFALLAGLRRPRLAVIRDAAGLPRLAIRGVAGVTSYSAHEIVRIQLSRTRRVGRSAAMLEIDVDDGSGERLLVFTRWDLGTNPHDVLDALAAAGLAH